MIFYSIWGLHLYAIWGWLTVNPTAIITSDYSLALPVKTEKIRNKW